MPTEAEHDLARVIASQERTEKVLQDVAVRVARLEGRDETRLTYADVLQAVNDERRAWREELAADRAAWRAELAAERAEKEDGISKLAARVSTLETDRAKAQGAQWALSTAVAALLALPGLGAAVALLSSWLSAPTPDK